ncbi:MGMT family protein [Streptomyces sp. NPDC059740]|uniref:MGMT family protein n=1 Tax=Streptomyces sp. NPDC059740 TaxID=3346926 RepID=UPI003658BDDE
MTVKGRDSRDGRTPWSEPAPTAAPGAPRTPGSRPLAAQDRAAPRTASAELPDFAERVLAVAERIPPGRVMTYGDVAAWLREDEPPREPGAAGPPGSGGPRQVGRVMALYGAAVPWWRVVRSDGHLLPGSEARALSHYRAEGTPLRQPAAPGGERPGRAAAREVRLDMRRARWDGDPAAGPHREPDGGPPGGSPPPDRGGAPG